MANFFRQLELHPSFSDSHEIYTRTHTNKLSRQQNKIDKYSEFLLQALPESYKIKQVTETETSGQPNNENQPNEFILSILLFFFYSA